MLKSTNGLSKPRIYFFRTLLFSALCTSILLNLTSCRTSRYQQLNKKLERVTDPEVFNSHHYGLLVVDAERGDTLIKRQSDTYFIPASNAKIFTLYTALKLLPEQLPSLKYTIEGDSLYAAGLGGPGILHPELKNDSLLDFMKSFKTVILRTGHFQDTPWPPGWSWEDFDQAFATERSSLPVYGNRLRLMASDSTNISPPGFRDSIQPIEHKFRRSQFSNTFYIPKLVKDTLEVPLIMSEHTLKYILGTALSNQVIINDRMPEPDEAIYYASERDSVLKRMMIESDNFLAEQLLLNASSVLSDTLSSRIAIDHMLNNDLSDLKHLPRWVDGSGLSRYNLFTPASMTDVLNRLYREYDSTYVLGFFPEGGVSGTLKEDFGSADKSYVFAKSGSMGNIYCLSGYLITRKGRLLIFSFMNNHFRRSSSEIKDQLRKVLEWIRDDL